MNFAFFMLGTALGVFLTWSTMRALLIREEIRNGKLRNLAACAYQLAGWHDAPEKWLDALSDAANGDDFDPDNLLPYLGPDNVDPLRGDK